MKKMYGVHSFLSIQFGIRLGVLDDPQFLQQHKYQLEENEDWSIRTIDHILNDLQQDNDDLKPVQVQYRQTLLSFLMAKDDNMILIITGFLQYI